MDTHGYIMDTAYTPATLWIHMINHGYYIHSSNNSMDRHVYITDATYTSAAAWIHMDISWILHTQQQQHGYTWIHHGNYIHSGKSNMDTHGYIMDITYKTAWIHIHTSRILHTLQQQHGYTWVHHGYYIHRSSSMDTHGYIMDTAYTAATAAWIYMDTSWMLHKQKQQHG
jgi:hypothetical protein